MEAQEHTTVNQFVPPVEEGQLKTTQEQTPSIVVIADECGDTLWDDVLAQKSNLATLLDKPANTLPNVDVAVQE